MFICILTEREAGIDALKQWEPVLNLVSPPPPPPLSSGLTQGVIHVISKCFCTRRQVGLEQKIATSVYEQNIKSTLIPAGHMVYT